MSTPLNIVLLEDDPADLELIRRELRRKGGTYVLREADSSERFVSALRDSPPDVILSDFKLCGLDGMDALRLARSVIPDVPFLLVSGSIGEETMAEALNEGVTDFVPKNRLLRLVPAIERAHRENMERAARRRAEASTRAADERFQAVFEASPDGILIIGAGGTVVAVNPAALRMFGYVAEELLDRPLTLLIPEEYRDRHQQSLTRAVQTGHSTMAGRTLQLRGLRKDGSIIPIELSLASWHVEGRPFFSGIIRDTTDRIAAAEAQERLTAILEATPDLVGLATADGRVLYLNRAGRALLGIEPSGNLTEHHISEFHPPLAMDFLSSIVFPSAALNGTWRGDVDFRSRHGEEIPMSMVLHTHRSPAGEIQFYSTISRDLREVRRLESQLRQAQKMDAIGRLAGGVAHDFNNLLTVINGYSQILLQSLSTESNAHASVYEIYKAGERAADLTRQLLSFSRKQVLRLHALDLNSVVRDTERLLRRMIGEDIRLVLQLQDKLGAIRGDGHFMEQVILNLAVNARDAMPDGGTLTIETADVVLDEAFARLHHESQVGPHVMLRITDTGCGMDAHVLSHIFEPFFTTKAPGRGTGLGLSTVFGIVKQCGGTIVINTEPGKGCAFRIYLPRTEPTGTNGFSEPNVDKPDEGGTETILLVEDEQAVRALARQILQVLGYGVVEACDGIQAQYVSDTHRGPIHLLLTDIVMPRMGGRELAERLCAARPALRILYMSGYTDDAVVRQGIATNTFPLLQKPFTPVSLARKVREALDAILPGEGPA